MNPTAKREGASRRVIIWRTVMPHLHVGASVPSSATLGRELGISRIAAYRRLRTVLEDAFIDVARVRGKGLVVVGVGEADG